MPFRAGKNGVMGNFLGAIKDNFLNGFASKKVRLLEETLQTVEEALRVMENERDTLIRENEEHREKIRNFDLVSEALKAKPVENKFVRDFYFLKENDYKKDFCDIEKGSNDAENLRRLDNIHKEMELIANCPQLHSKNIGAVGGGFSSGKSSFLNSFITGAKVKLAEGINPVTVIPSYVLCDDDSKVHGVSFRGGLFEIDLDLYKEISHEFMKSFDFDLKEVIIYTTVLAPMERKYFGNLCIIDTPGYNSPGSADKRQDRETAQEYIQKANFLIWTIGLDSEGTISRGDIDFLNEMNLFGLNPEKQLYIVANKAQLIATKDDIESILDSIEGTLDDYDLEYAGISAYNSLKSELLASRKNNIFEFLESQNRPSKKYAELKGMLDDVFRGYFREAHEDNTRMEEKRKEVWNLIKDAFAYGKISMDDDEGSVKLEEGLNKLLHYFQPKEQKEERRKRIEILRDKFLDCLNDFCDELGFDCTVETICQYCGSPLKDGKKVCPKCAAKFGPGVKFCPTCGKKLEAKAKFCTECGSDV